MSISWKVLAAAAAVTAVLSGCSSVSLDEGNKARWRAVRRSNHCRQSLLGSGQSALPPLGLFRV